MVRSRLREILPEPGPITSSPLSIYTSGVELEQKRLDQARYEAECGPVEAGFDPEAFTWHGREARARKMISDNLVLTVDKHSVFRLLTAAAKKLVPDESAETIFLEIGLAPRALAIRRSTSELGVKTYRSNAKTLILRFGAIFLVRQMEAQGWPTPGQFTMVWDEKSQMLVARKPGPITPGRV